MSFRYIAHFPGMFWARGLFDSLVTARCGQLIVAIKNGQKIIDDRSHVSKPMTMRLQGTWHTVTPGTDTAKRTIPKRVRQTGRHVLDLILN